jgi:hypothetical protein
MLNHHNFDNISKLLRKEDIVIVDNFLNKNVALFFRDRMIHSSSFDDYYSNYQAINYNVLDEPTKKLAESIVKQIEYLSNFQRSWSFIFNNKGKGVNWHADPSSINLNMWLSEDNSVKDFNKNGLQICKLKPPSSWTREEWNNNKNNCIDKFIEKNKGKVRKIKYKFNRAVFFDGAYFHKTDDVYMKEGKENKRVNYTMLFGSNYLKEDNA